MNYSCDESRNELELYHSGDSVRAYDFFGAHLVNWDGRDGVVRAIEDGYEKGADFMQSMWDVW